MSSNDIGRPVKAARPGFPKPEEPLPIPLSQLPPLVGGECDCPACRSDLADLVPCVRGQTE